MRLINPTAFLFAIVAAFAFTGASACTPRAATVPSVPEPATDPERSPIPPIAVEPSKDPERELGGEVWKFEYTPARYRYAIITDGQVAQFPDTVAVIQIPPVTQWVALSIDTGVIVVDPPTPTTLKCDSVASLHARAQGIVPRIPFQLSKGMRWRDSVTVDGCRGIVPMSTALVRNFLVIGDTVYDDIRAVLIQRTDSLVGRGEGHEGEHRIVLSVVGDGVTNLFFDVGAGVFLGALGTQTTRVTITTSGRTSNFLQRVKERITLQGQ